MELAAALRERDFEDRNRIENARENPHRRGHEDPLDPRLECPLGRLRVRSEITEAEYQAGVKWRNVYFLYLQSIGGPSPFPQALDWEGALITGGSPEMSDEDCERAAKAYKRGVAILEGRSKRIMHAVNAVAVFEEPDELGGFEYTAKAARIGLAALAKEF